MDIGVGQLLARTWRRIVGDGLAAKPAAPTLEATAGKRVAPADASTTQALALLDSGEQAQYLALEEPDRRYDIGARYGLLTAQLALALAGRDRGEVLAQILELLAIREMGAAAESGR